ncbi:hypothetical protein KP509_31G000200 [Ceratopteris richardii]|nr:hypothetical protein KP509_31G000200 [Ceratopteris richardii]
MKLPSFDASDLEKGSLQTGGSTKVVDCILSIKAFNEWQQAGGQGFWRLGGTFRTPASSKTPSSRPRLACSWLGSGRTSDTIVLSGSKNKEFMMEAESGCVDSSWVEDVCKRFVDAFMARSSNFDEMTSLESSNADINMPRETLLNMVAAVLHDKNPEEAAEFVECILKKVLQEFQHRIVQHKGQEMEGINCIHGGDAHKREVQNNELNEIKTILERTKVQFQDFKSSWEREMESLSLRMHGLSQAASEYHKVAAENRELYNQIQDLKGNIRVYCRVRPFLPGQNNGKSTVEFTGGKGSIVIANPMKPGKEHRKSFMFNKVFGPSASQEEVFLDTQPLIRSILDGYNVCIFAYGQTGSGKTYTMSGPNNPSPSDWGVNFRALHDLFKISQQRKDLIKYEVAVQMMEIYNEQVRDLLCSDSVNRKLEIRNNSQQNGLNVPDASLLPVCSIQDVMELMNLGSKNRAVGSTAMNERSSRSHSVLTIHVRGVELASRDVLRGCLHLVDLAGSERVDKSEVIGERLREAQHINKSLSALGDVIAALAQKSPHIPYRNSKLTQLLQDSLGGQAKTLMFVHVSPDEDSYGETISTLKFAERAATVELGAAQSNKESGELKDLRDQINMLRDALCKKEGELDRCQKELRMKNSEILLEKQRVKQSVSPSHSGLQAPGLGNLRSPLEEVGNTEIYRSPSMAQKSMPVLSLRKSSSLRQDSSLGSPKFEEEAASTEVCRSASMLQKSMQIVGLKKSNSVRQDSSLGLSRFEEECLKRRAYQNASSITIPELLADSGDSISTKKARASHEGVRVSPIPNNRYDAVESSIDIQLSNDLTDSVAQTYTAPDGSSDVNVSARKRLETEGSSSLIHEEYAEAESRRTGMSQQISDVRTSKIGFGKRRQDTERRHGSHHQAGHIAKKPITAVETADGARKAGRSFSQSKLLKAIKRTTEAERKQNNVLL